MNIKNLITRAGAGIIYILIVLGGIIGGKYPFIVVFSSLAGLGLYEFFRMVEKDTSHAISKFFNIFFGVIIIISVFLFLEKITLIALPIALLTYLLILFATAVFIHRTDILHAIIYSIFGQIYITLPFGFLLLISYLHSIGINNYHPAFVIALFVFIWVNDTSAYFFGSLFGKHKLLERISPKKSVEGFIMGIVFTILSSFIFAYYYPEYGILFWAGFGVTASLFGTLGDMFESLIKRTYNVKDTGNIIPGHGGVLDRIDSLLIAIPAVFLYLVIYITLFH